MLLNMLKKILLDLFFLNLYYRSSRVVTISEQSYKQGNFVNRRAMLLCIIYIYSSVTLANSNVPNQNLFDFVNVNYILKKYQDIEYFKGHDAQIIEYAPFPYCELPNEQPAKIKFAETFLLSIPYGRVSSENGFIIIGDRYMLHELVTVCRQFYFYINLILWNNFEKVRKVPGRVLVLTKQHADCYGHWIIEVLGRLALAEIIGIDYDWIYVSQEKKYMRETLQEWGIPLDKIIEPKHEFSHIQADTLLVPSIPGFRAPISGQYFNSKNQLCLYCNPFVIEYLRNKFISKALEKNKKKFVKRIFISRADGGNGRRVLNEEDVFNRFAQHGFEKYHLSQLSFLEQIALFNQAEIVAGVNGSGLTNIIFCNKNTQIVELFQGRADSSFYNIAQTLQLKYMPVKTKPFTGVWGHEDSLISLEIVDETIKNLSL